jgi:serine/threonine-protein kinase
MEATPSKPDGPADDDQLALPVSLPIQYSAPQPGEIITSMMTQNTYTMGEHIGEGYFGHVFGCTDSWDNRLAAKVLKPTLPHETLKTQAWDEFKKLLTVRHPFITYVYDAFEYNNACYIVTERCHSPLGELFAIENYDGGAWLLSIARCLLQAVDFIHINGMVHKDIHPGNVFTNFQSDAMLPHQQIINFKLGDLGIADLAQDVKPESTLANWMLPPESIEPTLFGVMDRRIDIYHSGLLFLQILIGRELQFTREQILEGAPRHMALQLPSPYSVALEKALRRRVEFRTASAKEFWRDLNSPVTPAIDFGRSV